MNKGYLLYENIGYKFIYKLKNLKSEIKVFYQRGRKGWSYVDAYSLDHYIAKIVSEAVKQIGECSHPPQLEPTEWDKIIAKIERGFTLYVNDDIYNYEQSKLKEEWIEAKELFCKWFEHLWD